MKKLMCAVLAGLMLLTAGCSGGEPAETTQAAVEEITTEAPTTYKFEDKIKANGFMPDMLPDTFPSFLPDGITCYTETLYYEDADTYDYKSDFVRLRLEGSASAFESLNSLMIAKGWTGGRIDITPDELGTESGSIQGIWSNGEYIAMISECEAHDEDFNPTYLVSLDVIENKFEFPEELTPFFPAFDAACAGEGNLMVYNKDGSIAENYGSINNCMWYRSFTGSNQFAGVQFEQLDNYVVALSEAGFKLTQSEQTNDHGNICTLTCSKEIDGKMYYCELTYIEYLHTVVAVYANDHEFFTQ